MVKIINRLGDVKIGKQGEVVYQRKHGEQIRRMASPKRAVVSEAQEKHRQLYKAALAWRKGLSLANRRYLDGYCISNWIVDIYKIPLAWSRFALRLYLEKVHFIIVKNPPGNPGGDPLYEYYNTGDNSHTGASDNWWHAQTFTPSIRHKITSVKLRLFRSGSPGTLTVGIRATNGVGKPTGEDLCVGTTDGDTLPELPTYEWREITLGNGHTLSANTKYAIVIRAIDALPGNIVYWRREVNSPTYPGGNGLYSSTSGSSWTLQPTVDFMFEDWGEAIAPPPEYKLLHVRHPALLAVVHKREEQIIYKYDDLSSLDDKYLTKQVGLDVLKGDVIEATTLPGINYRYVV